MSVVSLILIYLVVWWIVIFAILPWGIKKEADPLLGNDHGAPQHPHLGLKIIATTLISFIVWGLIYWCIEHKIVNLRS